MTMETTPTRTTYRQALEARGVTVIPTVDHEFVAYKPKRPDGSSTDMDFPLCGVLEDLGFYDYTEVALGRGLYVMGDVDSPLDQDDDEECEACSGSGECSECDAEGRDYSTHETCSTCKGTHDCPVCGGSCTQ